MTASSLDACFTQKEAMTVKRVSYVYEKENFSREREKEKKSERFCQKPFRKYEKYRNQSLIIPSINAYTRSAIFYFVLNYFASFCTAFLCLFDRILKLIVCLFIC